MNTKAQIVQIADSLIRAKGYNAFSFSNISNEIKIKNASIHYHFPTKTILGLAVINWHESLLAKLIRETENLDCLGRLNAFFSIYEDARNENKVCIIGSLATDFYTVEPVIQDSIKKLVNNILHWLILIINEGVSQKKFYIDTSARVEALMIITNMMAAVQLTRLTGKEDFETIKQTIINGLTKNK